MVIGIYGSGGMGKEIYDMFFTSTENMYDEAVFIDDVTDKDHVYGCPVLNYRAFIKNFHHLPQR